MLQFWLPIKKMAKVTPCLRKYALLTPNVRELYTFDPLSLHKVAIMTLFLRHVTSSQPFFDERDQNCQFF